jgi:hypothetical protein
MAAVTLTFKISQKLKNRSGKCSPLPTYQISFKNLQPFLRNRGVTKLILDKERKFLLASALSAIFKVNQNKQKNGLSNVPLYPPTKFHSNIFSRF